MRKYREYTDDDLILAIKESKSMATTLRKIGLKPCGGNYIHLKKSLQRLNIDTSHWKGQAWNKDEQLKDWSSYTKIKFLKKHLIKLKGNKCEKCNNEKWFDNVITLEVHHKDGNRTNNNLENLELLCPNCHSYTDNWRKQK